VATPENFRRRRLSAAALVLVVVVAGAAWALSRGDDVSGPQGQNTSTQSSAEGPNVLLILTDDQRGGLEVMPAVRRMFVREGRSYPNALTNIPVCCPSRASIFTGQYTHNHEVKTNYDVEQLDTDNTIQHYLQEAGYRTGIFGKYMNGWNDNPPGFDEWAIRIIGNRYVGGTWNVGGERQKVEQYSTDYISDKAVEFIESGEADDQRPWFLYIPTDAPHSPSVPDPQYQDAEVPQWDGNPAVFESDLSDNPPYTLERATTFEQGAAARDKQYRTLMSVDDLVADVLAAVKASGEERDTLVFFMSDNGYLWGEHGQTAKTHAYTESIAIPMFIRWPGRIEPGSSDDRLVGNMDVAPTIMAAAGLDERLGEMDARSLLDDSWKRDRFLSEYEIDPRSEKTPTWATLRTLDYQYVEYYAEDGETVEYREYYDLRDDPWELHNLLDDDTESNDPDVDALSRQLAADRACAGADCP
jgi:arylsulfatase A-like enzyme